MKKIERVLTKILIVMLIIMLILISLWIYCCLGNQVEKVSSTNELWEKGTEIYLKELNFLRADINNIKLDFDSCELKIKEVSDVDFYIKTTKELTECNGKAYVFLRIILLDKKLYFNAKSNNLVYLTSYTQTFMHELMHLKYFCVNEKYTSYMTFVTLYESNIPYFKYVALSLMNKTLNDYYHPKYDCSLNMLKYMIEKEK